jgi:hypothetical protein
VPVAAGLGFFAVVALLLWGIASLISHDDAATNRLTGRIFQPGPAKIWADIVAADGPVIFPDLLGTDGDKTVVLDHVGTDPLNGFTLYLANPADRPSSCKVTQIRFTRTFTDCEGRTLDVTALAPPPPGVAPVVSPGDGTLTLDLVPDSSATPTTPTATSTTAT